MLSEERSVSSEFLCKTIPFDSPDVTFHPRSSAPAWNPNISVLELACKLRVAEQNVFGHTQAPQSTANSSAQYSAHSVMLDGRPGFLMNSAVKREPIDQVPVGLNGDGPVLQDVYSLQMPAHELMRSQMYPFQVLGDIAASIQSNPHHGGIDRTGFGRPTPGGMFMDGDRTESALVRPYSESPVTGGSETPQQQRHHCQQCSYTTKNLHHMRRHCATVHTETKPYQCFICDLEFARSEKVREHFVSFHPDVAYDYKLVRKFNVGNDSGKEVIPAGDTKSRIRALFQNIEGIDMEFEKDPDRPFGCLRCSYATRDLWHLRRHVLDVHAARKQHNCRICRYATNRSLRLQAHMRGHGELFCEYCWEFSTLQPDHFTLHDKLCSALAAVKSAGFRCRGCGLDCGDRSKLRSHSVELHGLELAACDECPFYAYTSDEFIAHVEVHEAISRTCGLCGVTFTSRVERDQHDILMHLISRPSTDGGRDLACGVCGEVSEPRGSLEPAIAHVRRHVPDAVECKEPDCKFKSILPQSLEMHTRYYHASGNPEASEPLLARPKVDPVTLSNMSIPRDRPVEKGIPYQVSAASTSLVGTFACSICGPKRTPFKYWRSYEKHMAQHCMSGR